jgi:hypothetical protein
LLLISQSAQIARYNQNSAYRNMTLTSIEPTETNLKPLASAHLRQLALQFAAVFAVLSLAWPYFGLRGEPLPWPETAFAIGGCALLFSVVTRQPWWWLLIHTFFAPLLWGASGLAIEPGWFLLSFLLLLIFFRGAASGQIPLYFSNYDTATALAEVTRDIQGMRFIDLGAGIGSVIRPLAALRPDAHLTGIENAPATWLLGFLSTARLAECSWRWGDFWGSSLSKHNVVYVFLSPAPMSALWIKVQREMRPGSLFISNSFAVPDVTPDQVVEVDDERQTRLYCYRI